MHALWHDILVRGRRSGNASREWGCATAGITPLFGSLSDGKAREMDTGATLHQETGIRAPIASIASSAATPASTLAHGVITRHCYPKDLADAVFSDLMNRTLPTPPLAALCELFEGLYFASLRTEE